MNKDALIAALMVGGGSGGGTEVIANPTLVGTESDLTGIQVGDTKYKVPEELPDTTGASVGDILTNGEDGPEWATPSGGLPEIESGDAGKVLAVNAGETGAEWATPSGGAELWQHIAYIVISGSPIADLNGKSLECVFLSGSEEFTLATGPREWAFNVRAPLDLVDIGILNQATGDILVRCGSSGFTAKTSSSTDPTYTVSYGNHLRII